MNMSDINPEIFKKYSSGKDFTEIIHEFDTDKKMLKEKLTKIKHDVYHYTQLEEDDKTIKELINIANLVQYYLENYLKKGSGLKILTPNQMLTR